MKKLLIPLIFTSCFLLILNLSNAKPKNNHNAIKAREIAKKECIQEMPDIKGKSLQKCIKRKTNYK